MEYQIHPKDMSLEDIKDSKENLERWTEHYKGVTCVCGVNVLDAALEKHRYIVEMAKWSRFKGEDKILHTIPLRPHIHKMSEELPEHMKKRVFHVESPDELIFVSPLEYLYGESSRTHNAIADISDSCDEISRLVGAENNNKFHPTGFWTEFMQIKTSLNCLLLDAGKHNPELKDQINSYLKS